jgi:hypothetical protein
MIVHSGARIAPTNFAIFSFVWRKYFWCFVMFRGVSYCVANVAWCKILRMANSAPIRITRIGKGRGSFYLKLPREWVRANNLKPGDMIMPDLSTFRIVRQEDLPTLSQEPEAIPA